MSWLNIFRSNAAGIQKMESRSHFQNLIDMAKADGYYDQVEKEYLVKIAKSYNVCLKNIEELDKNVSKIPMAERGDQEAIFRQLYELVGMMLADGIVHNVEIELCAKFAEEMGVGQGNGSMFISKLVKSFEEGASHSELSKYIKAR